ncbi:MAG: 50S ribosomal protein L21 [bacterium]
MYAIVDVGGVQLKVRQDEEVLVPKLAGEVGQEVVFDKVLFLSDKGKTRIGQPTVKGASVKAKIQGDARGKKVIVFKKKRRKGYKVRRGHRQEYTAVTVESINTKAAQKEAK